MRKTISILVAALFSLALIGCNGGGGSHSASSVNLWTWMSGSDQADQAGVYGIQGTPDAANVPGSRNYMVGAKDISGNYWVFGGWGEDSTGGTQGKLNDLWRWDGSNWTWISGSNFIDQTATYGAKGVADAANVPGARNAAMGWADASDNIWIFGGYDAAGPLNDLWRWDGTNWAWMAGSDATDQSGVYGIKGTADAANVPGARVSGTTWTDAAGNLWLFGGSGYDSTGAMGLLNDLWRWDGTNWTWMSGSNLIAESGTYGVKGTADAANVPGARTWASGSIDENDNLWLFGGKGIDSAGTTDRLNDLWRWDGSNWTWISGSNIVNQIGSYGIQGTADAANVPGARSEHPISWIDGSGNFWLFGGVGYDKDGSNDILNDLWRWDGSNWTWVSGSNIVAQAGTYGVQGIADAANVPGAREAPKGWVDDNGDLWLFGGLGQSSVTTWSSLNDLWRYQP